MRINYTLLLAFVFALLFWNSVWLCAQQISSFSPQEISGGMGDVLTIRGSGFGNSQSNSYVSFFLENGAYSSPEVSRKYAYLRWTNTEIQLQMPVAFSNRIKLVVNGTEVFSQNSLRVKANLSYREASHLLYDLLIEDNNQGGITWFVHSQYWGNLEIREAIEDVFREFRCKTGVNYVIAPLEGGVPVNLNQGKYIIGPDNSLNVPGFNDKLWFSCILGAETFFYNRTQVMRFKTNENWFYGKGRAPAGRSKFRYVLMHELGHSLGLAHVNEEGQTMFPSVTLLPSNNWSERDSITTEERRAVDRYVQLSQNFTFRACGVRPMGPITDCEAVYDILLSTNEHQHEPIWATCFPNPAVSYINIISNYPDKIKSLQIMSMTGQVIMRQEGFIVDKAINLPASMSPGVYVIVMMTDRQPIIQKFIKS
jgi:hypothetical protein